ncbi:L-arabinose transport system permease protein AraQ [Microbacterium hydrocarbonoxydans]|uniref:L-arabinose transport system permease protein AraQ n=1 Tax=Microbacterium hydrocarbonoxydans TaxID=273678 RepID=A0A0M2HV15_9MICO|nr:carbohydrate ABC transporter permease [Microbacterium hydrocarbonoxydans]KJL48293.1 L-arabinose transport system permease protein AraQ [Microbacterium hydrocarbonoxydans]
MTSTMTRPPRTGRDGDPRRSDRDLRAGARSRQGGWGVIPTVVLIAGAIYCLIPVAWVFMAASKSKSELFTTFSFSPGSGLWDNVVALFTYQGGQYLLWCLNSLLYSGVASVLSVLVSAMAGFALAKYTFRGRTVIFFSFLVGILIPGIVLAVPQYLLMSGVGLAGTQWSVLLPSIVSPFGIYLCRVYAMSAVPQDTLEAARIDGAGEWRIFRMIVLPLMVPGMVTVFLLHFIGTWNNFLLPFIMLSDQDLYPLTVGLFTLLSKGSSTPALYSVAITGAAISIIPLVALVLSLQRYWRLDLISGGIKG